MRTEALKSTGATVRRSKSYSHRESNMSGINVRSRCISTPGTMLLKPWHWREISLTSGRLPSTRQVGTLYGECHADNARLISKVLESPCLMATRRWCYICCRDGWQKSRAGRWHCRSSSILSICAAHVESDIAGKKRDRLYVPCSAD